MGLKFNSTKTLYEDITKKTFTDGQEEYCIVEYSDYLSNGFGKIKSKNLGERFASINSFFFEYLKEYNIPSGYVKKESNNSIKFIKHELFPFSIKILNSADKRNSTLFGLKENHSFTIPLFEIRYGRTKDNLVSENHLLSMEICSVDTLKFIYRLCSKINAIMKSYFERRGFSLTEFTCSFGKSDEKVYLVNDFTPVSIKVYPLNEGNGYPNPNQFSTSKEIKLYTEHLYNMTRS